ncbi:MAG: hypothetical protein FWE27_05455 [Defluviitaleaceae bacterium]|nr:hypothetical protein [Defluviitaleaceae bacterium]
MDNKDEGVGMNLLIMTEKQKREEIQKANARTVDGHMGNDPLYNEEEKSYLDFIIEGYELKQHESEAE